jgi:hypothetical protein
LISGKFWGFFAKYPALAQSEPPTLAIRRLRKSRDVAIVVGVGIGQDSYQEKKKMRGRRIHF